MGRRGARGVGRGGREGVGKKRRVGEEEEGWRGGRGRKGEGGREQGQEWVAGRRGGVCPLAPQSASIINCILDNTLKGVLSPGWEGKEVGTQHSGRNV